MSSQITKKTIDGWPLGFRDGEHQPLISELDLGVKFRYARPDDGIRLIDRMVAAGKFNESEFLHTPWENHGGRGRPRKDDNGGLRWLNREQALLAATQSDTPVAWDITREMVRVFQRVLDGFFVPIEQLDALRNETAALRSQLDSERAAYRTFAEAQSPRISETEQRRILDRVDEIAKYIADAGLRPSYRSAHRSVRNRTIDRHWEGPVSEIPVHSDVTSKIMCECSRVHNQAKKEARARGRVPPPPPKPKTPRRRSSPRPRPQTDVPGQQKLFKDLH